jgi:hypothetical protein
VDAVVAEVRRENEIDVDFSDVMDVLRSQSQRAPGGGGGVDGTPRELHTNLHNPGPEDQDLVDAIETASQFRAAVDAYRGDRQDDLGAAVNNILVEIKSGPLKDTEVMPNRADVMARIELHAVLGTTDAGNGDDGNDGDAPDTPAPPPPTNEAFIQTTGAEDVENAVNTASLAEMTGGDLSEARLEAMFTEIGYSPDKAKAMAYFTWYFVLDNAPA